ncbi:DUF4145 domain-containing protein [Geothrix fermentans]|jgi:hypothetical protein|uniref:DUF4145 domain-containing protein n=1 Tax=Geothrix fermentans TaxID=44676 RepID=UPI0005B92B2C|nr:DUF4145 domain-containing protein [Geothrix fermentans]
MSSSFPPSLKIAWQNLSNIPAKQYECSFCGASVAPDKGWYGVNPGNNRPTASIFICHQCTRPTFIDPDDRQYPGKPFGQSVDGIPEQSLRDLFDEARNTMSASCYTASVLCCRKILMHIAVEKGAAPGDKFIKYVEHLSENNYIPPDAKGWVDHIRTKANEANHEITVMTRIDAEELLSFTEMLLKVIYEFPAAIKKRITPPA